MENTKELKRVINRFITWLNEPCERPDASLSETNRTWYNQAYFTEKEAFEESGGNFDSLRDLSPVNSFDEEQGVFLDLLWAEDQLQAVYY